jgi:hypothetical protein
MLVRLHEFVIIHELENSLKLQMRAGSEAGALGYYLSSCIQFNHTLIKLFLAETLGGLQTYVVEEAAIIGFSDFL